MALVVKSWRADTTKPDADGNLVVIECRQEGIIAFLLNLAGIAPTSTIKIGSERVEFTKGSFEGFERRMIPLQGICSTYYGYQRPWKAVIGLISAAVFFGVGLISAIGAWGLLFILLAIGGSILYYILNKKLALGFVENSGFVSGIQFKRSVIEGQRIEEEDARRVCTIVQSIIEAGK